MSRFHLTASHWSHATCRSSSLPCQLQLAMQVAGVPQPPTVAAPWSPGLPTATTATVLVPQYAGVLERRPQGGFSAVAPAAAGSCAYLPAGSVHVKYPTSRAIPAQVMPSAAAAPVLAVSLAYGQPVRALCSAVPAEPSVSVAPQRAAPGGPDAAAQQEGEIRRVPVGREVNAVSLSPDGRLVAVGLQDNTVQIWDLTACVMVHMLRGHKYWVNHVAFASDGIHVASASADKTIKVWNIRDGSCEVTLQGHLLSVAAVAFSEEGTRLASGSWDKTVCVWEVSKGHPVLTFTGHTDWVHSVVWAPGSRHIASASSDHSVRVWSAETGLIEQVLVGHQQTVTCLSFARSGIFLASGSLDRTVRVWNVQEGSLSARLQQDCDDGSVHSVAFASDCERVVVGCSGKCLKVWDFRTGEREAHLSGHEDAVLSVCVTTDGACAVSGSHDKTVRVWRLPPKSMPRASPGWLLPKGCVAEPSAAASFKALHERLKNTEDMNQKLRQQLSEAQTELEQRMRAPDALSLQKERQLASYRDMIANLRAEKEQLERRFNAMRRERSPAGDAEDVAPLGLLGGRRSDAPLNTGAVLMEPVTAYRNFGARRRVASPGIPYVVDPRLPNHGLGGPAVPQQLGVTPGAYLRA